MLSERLHLAHCIYDLLEIAFLIKQSICNMQILKQNSTQRLRSSRKYFGQSNELYGSLRHDFHNQLLRKYTQNHKRSVQ